MMYLSAMTQRILEPGFGGEDQQVRNGGQATECSVGHFELLMEFFCLLSSHDKHSLMGLVDSTTTGQAAAG